MGTEKKNWEGKKDEILFLPSPSKAQCQSCKLLPQNTYRMHFNVIVPYSGWPREEHDTIKKKKTQV